MACFLVPLAQAAATTIVRRHIQNKSANPWVTQLSKLELMLWGGSAMLIIDHILSGEVVPYYPFFSALETQGGASVMLHEMLVVGFPMSLGTTLIYLALVAHQYRTQKI